MRGMISWLAPAAATFATWWIFLGTDSDDQYTVFQVAAMVAVLLVIGVAFGWSASKMDHFAIIVSAVVGISAACWLSWSDDESGLFGVGWLMVTIGTAVAASALVIITWQLRQRLAPVD